MVPTVTSEHSWLKKLVGKWKISSDPNAPDEHKFEGTETFRSIGDVWVQGESISPWKDTEHRAIMTLGFDPAKGRFVGSWIGTMMNTHWVYAGFMEGSSKLVLESVGPTFDDTPGENNYRDVIEFHSEDHRTLTAYVQKPDGSWDRFMTTQAHRI